MRIGWLTPFSRASAIGQFSSIVADELQLGHDVTIYVSDVHDPEAIWPTRCRVRFLADAHQPISADEMVQYDLLVYNLGNHVWFHKDIFEISLNHPGLVILHDLVMHHFFSMYYLEVKKNHESYLRELARSHGQAGTEIGKYVTSGKSTLDFWSSDQMLEFHMAPAAVQGGFGVVVHSDYALKALQQTSPVPVKKIEFPRPLVADSTVPVTSESGRRVRILTYGMVNPNKLVRETIRSIAESPVLRERVQFDVVGAAGMSEEYFRSLQVLTKDLGLSDQVTFHGRQPDEVLHEKIHAADIILNIRNPHFGESSWTLLETLHLAKPTVVWKHGYYDEFPDDVVVKVDSMEKLTPVLEQLVLADGYRGILGERARSHARSRFSTSRYCTELMDFARRARYYRPIVGLSQYLDAAAKEVSASGPTASDLRKEITREVWEMIEYASRAASAPTPAVESIDDPDLRAEVVRLRRRVDDVYWREQDLRTQLDRYVTFYNAVTRSRLWKLIQTVRRWFGRAW
jgi:glycosyltransferase involved in cell wall biosynthesis